MLDCRQDTLLYWSHQTTAYGSSNHALTLLPFGKTAMRTNDVVCDGPSTGRLTHPPLQWPVCESESNNTNLNTLGSIPL